MERSKTQFARLMELDQWIRNRRYPNCLKFSLEWGVSQKTVQRDIDFMRDQLRAPIAYDREKKGFYYEKDNWFLPSLSLSEGDLLTLLISTRALEAYSGTPVAKELEGVFQKIARLLPDKLTIRPELVFSRFSFTSPPARPIDEKTWIALVRALTTQTVVKMSYRTFEAKEPFEKLLCPYHIANLQGEWYVLGAYFDTPADIRQFSIARITKTSLTDKHYTVPVDFDPEKMLGKTFSRFVGAKASKVRLLFDKEIAAWVLERQWHPRQKTIKRKNGDIELSFEVTGKYEVFRWVLAWGHYVKVLEPAELKKMVRDEAKLMARGEGKA